MEDGILRVGHIGIAVKSIDSGIKIWGELLGIKFEGITEVPSQKLRIGVFNVGDVEIELLEPTSADSSVAKFIDSRGEGLHHICFKVKNIEGILSELKAKGVKLIDESPRVGALASKIAFIHPSSTGGVLIELAEDDDSKFKRSKG